MYKETDLTNIKCEKCQHSITYEYVSFQGRKCTIGNHHASGYSVKCSQCRKGYGPWIPFNLSLFPGFSDPDKCPCMKLCTYCGYNESSEKCCGRNRDKNAHLLRQRHRGIDDDGFDDDLYRMCLKCGKWDRMCDGICVKPEAEAGSVVKSDDESAVKSEGEAEPAVKPVAEPAVKEWVPINKRKYGLFSLDDTMKIMLTPLKDYVDEKKNMFAYESRKSINKLNLRALQYPFSFINDDIYYKPEKICTGLVEEEPIKPGNFPNNILEYYWIHEGENDGMGDDEAWHLFCKIKAEDGENAYVYYTASCDYTGFDCQGSMRMYISRNANALIDSLNKPIQKLFMKAKGYCFRENSGEEKIETTV